MPSGFRYERKLADLLEKKGFHCERVASSGSRRNSVCDLVAVKDGVAYFIEVKTRKAKVFYTKRFRESLRKLSVIATKVKAMPVLAVLFKRKGWVFLELNKIPEKVEYSNQKDQLKMLD